MDDPHIFEQEVRRIARFRWPSAEFGGAEQVDGRERDGVFETEDVIHLLEATTSREKAKAQKDLSKMYELYKKLRSTSSEKAIKCWFVTKYEPTAEQRGCRKDIKGAPQDLFNIVSFNQFQSKLIDSHDYLSLRKQHKFGSIYDPKTGNPTSDVPYIDVGLRFDDEVERRSPENVANAVIAGKRLCLLGEYGVGKSMTLREIFRYISKAHFQTKIVQFPVYLNLREHQGQQEPAEILERHGRNIGFPNPSQLVRAWKAGYVILLLDGYDEVSSHGLQGAWRKLRDARNASMTGVRRLITETPNSLGIVVAGRHHFFDSDDERFKALGLSSNWSEIRLDEFNDDQIRALTAQYGFAGEIPSWVPARPLLLSTLFAKGLTDDATSQLAILKDASAGWDFLLDEVCRREANIESTGVSGENIRAILESLATQARSKDSGIGPISPDDIIKLFQAECGFTPADESLIVAQRLPGLGRDPAAIDESRAFVDIEFADACRAGDFVRFCSDPFNQSYSQVLAKTRVGIGRTGLELALHKLRHLNFAEAGLTAAVKSCDRLELKGAIPADLLGLSEMAGFKLRHSLQVSKISIELLDLPTDRPDFGNIVFIECYFGRLIVPHDLKKEYCPTFQGCLVQELEGRVTENDLPDGRFLETFIESYESSSQTSSAALDLKLPLGVKVLVTILKKLFVQSIAGRKENALFRGLDSAHQSKVTAVLRLLKSSGLIHESGRAGDPIWIPIRRYRNRALGIITAPNTTQDIIVNEAKLI